MTLIQLKNVKKTYHMGGGIEVEALRGMSLDIEGGEFVAVMGPSGSGKSTLLAILGLLDTSDSGQYLLSGKNISGLGESDYARLRNRFFGFVFQTFNLLPKLNVTENVMLPFIYSCEATPENRAFAMKTLSDVGLADRLRHRPNELSGGQQQRAALARALANKPLVILADEPTGNLDSKSSEEIMKLFKKLNEEGNTIIMVTHEHDIAAWASRIVSLHDGMVISDERKRETPKIAEEKLKFHEVRAGKFCGPASLRNYIYEAFLAISSNKLRSALSILGVLIGVAAVITMLALGTGAQRQMQQNFAALGTNVLRLHTTGRFGGISLGTAAPTRFTFEDMAAYKKIVAVEQVAPYVQSRGQVVYGDKNWNTSITGTSVDYPDLHPVTFQFGRFFTKAEADGRNKVAVLGQTVAKQLFGATDPVGEWIRINRINFTVVGVMDTIGAMGFQNQDDRILIPVKTAMYRLMGQDYISYFEVKVRDLKDSDYVSSELINETMRLHRLPESQRQSIEIMNMAQIQQTATAVITALSYLLGAVAAVSLLVGGIGIMNIMLVTVMERTHEIGLRKALGAERKDILIQFLVEATAICLLGGSIGIIFGVIVSFVLSSFANWVIYISPGSVILAFGFSVIIGVVFGMWPAWRAAKLLPVEALRYE